MKFSYSRIALDPYLSPYPSYPKSDAVNFNKKGDATRTNFLALLIAILILSSNGASSATYYIAPNGSDAAIGDLTHPFATLKKAWTVVAAGDIIYLRGGTYTFTTQQALSGKNGTAANLIKVWAYPSESPVLALNNVSKGITLTGNYINFKGIEINGLTTLTGWTNAGNGIYSVAVSCESPSNMVTINGVNTAMGRYPNADAANSGYLTIDAPNSSNTITDAALPLPSVIDWTGAELVARRDHFTIDRDIVTAHISHTLTYDPYSGGELRGMRQGFGYFLQNSLSALDQTGEWFYNGTVLYMVNPGTSVVKTSTVSDLFYISSCNYVTFTNCAFTGGNQSNLRLINSKFTNITGCTFDFAGKNALEVWVGGSSDSLTVRNSVFNNANNCAILLRENTPKVLIERNSINNTGIFQGMASKTNIDGSHEAIFGYKSAGITVQNNTIVNTGYCGIALYEDQCINTLIKNNFVDTFCSLKDDGGGIYSYRHLAGTDAERIIEGNIILNGVGCNNGTDGTVNPNASGIYLDGYVNHMTIIKNTSANNAYSGVQIHNTLDVTVHDNTFYNNAEGQIVLVHDGYGLEIRNANITRNISFVKGNNFLNQLQKTIEYYTSSDDFTLFGTLDSNYYCAPLTSVPANALVFKTENSAYQGVFRTFAGWKSFIGKDANSHLSATTVPNASYIRFDYNDTTINKTIALAGTYIDVKGTQFIGSITLLPYTSSVLMLTSASSNQFPVIQNQVFQLNENSPNATVVGTVLASDPDAGQTLSYSILSGNTNGAFAINAATGAITVANSVALNYEAITSFALVIKVQDNGTGSLSSQATVTVNLINVNELPVISNQVFSINENSVNGTAVGNVVASDPDAGQTLSYSILSGNTNSAFAINATNGTLTVASSSALNYEAITSFALVVKVQDNGTGNLSSQATVTVNLINVNELPVISNQVFSINENSVNGTAVGNVMASDPDAGQTLSYSILSGNTNGAFAINAATGAITVANSVALNYEAITSFALVIKVQDNGTGSLSSQATVTVNLINLNELPVISNQVFSINENSVNGTAVGNVVASDPDAGQTLSYSILSGNTNGAFAINAATGAITVSNSAALDYETVTSFTLVVKVQDNGTGSLSSQATVTVNLINANELPVINNQVFSINENSVNGTAVGNVVASDPDAGQTLSYSILSGNTNGAFAMNAATGAITVANSATLDYETVTSFTLVIKVQDNGTGSLSSQATVTVNLINLNELPVISNQVFSINENSVNGTAVGNVVASDPDAGQTISYSIISGNTNGAFAINAATGAITVANSAALNYETVTSFALVVKVQDNGTGSLSSQATVTVNLINANELPVINNQVFSINENSVNGTAVGNVVASDPDAGQTLSYSILSGNINGAFAINATTGVIAVTNSAALDYEAVTSFALVVKVQDNGTGNLSSQATVTVNLINANELPAISNQVFSINENSVNGTAVGNVVASDPDAGQTISYSIISGNTNGAFAINAATGAITVANSAALNYETVTSFALVVKVQDNGTGSLSSQATVTVNLINVNESPVANAQSFNVTEFATNATFVGTVTANDPDAGQTLTYNINAGNISNAFVINPATGSITVNNAAALDFLINPVFYLIVRVTDNGTGNLFDDAIITVNVVQSLNQPPVINNQTFMITENSVNGTAIGNIVASDPDAGQTLSYSILSGNTNGAFAINISTGALTVANSTALNYEANTSFALVVKVQDNGTGNLSNQADVTVTLIDINEPPAAEDQIFSILELSAAGTQVGIVTATDQDAGQTLTFNITSGNTSNAFSINSITGEISVANSAALDFLVNPVFNLEVTVTDNGNGNMNDIAIIIINVLQNSNQPPVINNQSLSVIEYSVNGSVVDTVSATDPDTGQTLSFTIESGNTGNAFSIDASTGIVTVNNSSVLDFQVNPVFYLIVKVTDNGTGNLYDNAVITIDVLPTPNHPPVIVDQAFILNENSIAGTIVGTVLASDPDAGQFLTYSILSGNTNSAFIINNLTGELSVSNSAALDFETFPYFLLEINVQDNGMGFLSRQAIITVSLLDLNESPNAEDQTFNIIEMSLNGTLVGTVTATEPDFGQTLNYSIISGNTDNAFALNPTNGNLTVNNSVALDFLTNPVFILNIRVTDNGIGNLYDDAVISVNLLQNSNQPPLVSDLAFRIDENSPNNMFVGSMNATDPDAGQSLTYSIVNGNTGGAFGINTLTGELFVADSSVLNFEVINLFSMVVQVQDNGIGNLFSRAFVDVTLLDKNESPIISDQAFNVYELSANGTSVGSPAANDPDAGQTITYSIVSGNSDNAFSIDPFNGLITVNNSAAINLLINTNFNLVVRVTDDGEGYLYGDAVINIVVLQFPNQPPLINDQTFAVNENSITGYTVGTVLAIDPDAGQVLTYSLTGGNTNNAFSIDVSTGLITVNNPSALNFELGAHFIIQVIVQDNGSGNLTSSAHIKININDVNEPPVMADQTFSIQENPATGSLIGKLTASDQDAGQDLSYSIISGNTGNSFSLDASTGDLTVLNPALLVYALNPVFVLQVAVQDNGPGTLVTTASVTINLLENTDHFVYIDPSQTNNPQENGSILHPFNSWTDVIFSDGYSYFQKRGTTFNGTSNIIVYAKNKITIDAYGTGNPPVIQNNLPNSKIIDLSSSKNCTIRNIEIKSAGAALCGIYLSGNLSSEINIDNCNIHDVQFGVRSIVKVSGLHIINCMISKSGLDGIYAANFLSIEIGNCTIYDVNQKWLQNPNASESTGDCIELNSASGIVNIHHNILTHSSTGNMAVVAISGTSYSGLIENNTMTGNRLVQNECLRLNSSNKTMVVRFNTITDGLYGINSNIASCTVYYNQFIVNSEAIRIQKNRLADIKNNTFYSNISYAVESLSGASITSRNNIFYLDALSSKVYKFGGSNVSNFNSFNIEKSGFLNGYSTLSAWSSATNQDKNSILADPQFVNISGEDFRLQTSSPCINKGTNVSLTKDFFGTSVPQAGIPDIGFHEVASVASKNNPSTNTDFQNINNGMPEVSLYPNPTAGNVKIKVENTVNVSATINILDMQGKTVETKTGKGETEISLNLGDQNPGIYLAVININGQVITRKIILQN